MGRFCGRGSCVRLFSHSPDLLLAYQVSLLIVSLRLFQVNDGALQFVLQTLLLLLHKSPVLLLLLDCRQTDRLSFHPEMVRNIDGTLVVLVTTCVVVVALSDCLTVPFSGEEIVVLGVLNNLVVFASSFLPLLAAVLEPNLKFRLSLF